LLDKYNVQLNILLFFLSGTGEFSKHRSFKILNKRLLKGNESVSVVHLNDFFKQIVWNSIPKVFWKK
jgi:hypothetical protein